VTMLSDLIVDVVDHHSRNPTSSIFLLNRNRVGVPGV
jgi:hypothetical protein